MLLSRAVAFSVFDSRGTPTVAVMLHSGSDYALGMSPSGASAGSHEAYEMRDGGSKFQGKGVSRALTIFSEKVAPALLQQDFHSQEAFDTVLRNIDGTENFQQIGGNTAIAASIAFAKLQAQVEQKELFALIAEQFDFVVNQPVITPLVNVFNGGKHASSGLAIQEVMIVPMAGVTTTEKIAIASQVFGALKTVLKDREISTLVGDEGGFAPNIEHLHQALDFIKEACDRAGFNYGKDIKIALDVAATELLSNDQYAIENTRLTAQQLVNWYRDLANTTPVISIEDPFGEDDFSAWQMLAQTIGDKTQIVGDDLTVTNVARMKIVQEQKLVSAIIIKPNQIGTISQTIAAIKLAREYGWKPILSHRSGETEDTTIADIAYAVTAPFIKTGSMSRSDRMAKYNRLLTIEQIVKSKE